MQYLKWATRPNQTFALDCGLNEFQVLCSTLWLRHNSTTVIIKWPSLTRVLQHLEYAHWLICGCVDNLIRVTCIFFLRFTCLWAFKKMENIQMLKVIFATSRRDAVNQRYKICPQRSVWSLNNISTNMRIIWEYDVL